MEIFNLPPWIRAIKGHWRACTRVNSGAFWPRFIVNLIARSDAGESGEERNVFLCPIRSRNVISVLLKDHWAG